MQRCDKHMFDEAVVSCRDCGAQLCVECVVPVSTASYCIPCALERAGVRQRRQRTRVFAFAR